jgi:serine/threonine protein kinase
LLQGVFTNKSDIWAIGCILYHLILERPAFRNEYAVFDYNSDPDKVLDIAIDAQTLPDERRRAFLSKVIQEMLDRGPQMRPRAEELYKKFTGWGVESSDPQPGARSPGPVSGKMAVEQGGTEGGTYFSPVFNGF